MAAPVAPLHSTRALADREAGSSGSSTHSGHGKLHRKAMPCPRPSKLSLCGAFSCRGSTAAAWKAEAGKGKETSIEGRLGRGSSASSRKMSHVWAPASSRGHASETFLGAEEDDNSELGSSLSLSVEPGPEWSSFQEDAECPVPTVEYKGAVTNNSSSSSSSSSGSPQESDRLSGVQQSGDSQKRSQSSFVNRASGGGGGLMRSPTTGGVHSATSSLGLLDPAVAVRNLVGQSKYGHLCTIMSRMHHRRRGYPFGSLVDFATDSSGHPVFSLSPLAIHTRNLLADPRCTLVVQIPGWSGLADARVTLFGDVYPLPSDQQEWAQQVFCARHRSETSYHWGNFHFFRMDNICDIYFVGGFGTVAWIDVREYTAALPDKIATENQGETLQVLNVGFADKFQRILSEKVANGAAAIASVEFISIDSKGVDVRVQEDNKSHVHRLSFSSPVDSVSAAEAALQDVLQSALPMRLLDQLL